MAEDGLGSRLFGLLLPTEELHEPPETVPEVAPGLHEVIAVAGDAGLDDASLDALGSPSERRELAHRNLRAMPIEKHEVVHADEGGAYHVLSGETAFTASRVLVLEDLAPRLTGQPIPEQGALVAMPTKFHLLLHPITGGTVLTVLAAMAQATAGLFSSQEARLSPHVHWWRHGEMTRLTVVNGQSLGFEFPDEFRALLGEIPEPVNDPVQRRPHHYHFVHTVLRQVSAENGSTLLANVQAGDLTQLLEETWQDVGEDLPPEERLSPDGLRGNVIILDDRRVLLVTLPEPTGPAEAHYAAMVQPSDMGACRFFTLEYATDPITHEPGAILGEWKPDGHHLHLTGMTTDPGDFLKAIAGLLAEGTPVQEPRPAKRRGLFRRG